MILGEATLTKFQGTLTGEDDSVVFRVKLDRA
jgi:hypothetical protein